MAGREAAPALVLQQRRPHVALAGDEARAARMEAAGRRRVVADGGSPPQDLAAARARALGIGGGTADSSAARVGMARMGVELTRRSRARRSDRGT